MNHLTCMYDPFYFRNKCLLKTGHTVNLAWSYTHVVCYLFFWQDIVHVVMFHKTTILTKNTPRGGKTNKETLMLTSGS